MVMPAVKGIGNYVGVVAGSFILALGMVLFLIPNKIAAGGVGGLATIIYHLAGFPVGITMLVLNIPLFLAGLYQLGWNPGLKTLVGTVGLSVFIDFAPVMVVPTRDPLLASIYGGILVGLGLGLVFRAGGTTGGTDLAAQIARRFVRVTSGTMVMAIDGIVIALDGLVFGVELALYSMISLYVLARVIDLVQEGVGYFKAALIISDYHEVIGQKILHQLNRGVTALHGKGLYTGKEREVLLCVVSRPEVTKLMELVALEDPKAFVIVDNVHEALGEGFKENWEV